MNLVVSIEVERVVNEDTAKFIVVCVKMKVKGVKERVWHDGYVFQSLEEIKAYPNL
jgi:hypothetical protein